jgi:hypothetical protein
VSKQKVTRTWVVTPELAEWINETAAACGLHASDLVCFLLTVGLDQVEAGKLRIPMRPAGPPNRVDWARVTGKERGDEWG